MSLKISRILHAGYILETKNAKVVFDPIFENPLSRNCHAFPDVKFDLEKIKNLEFDAVFISHFHDDHLSMESLNFLSKVTPIYLFCVHDELFHLIRDLGFLNVYSLVLNSAVRIGEFIVIPHKALDEDIDCIFQIQVDGLNILNVVDSWMGYDTLDKLVGRGPWDFIMWPFQTMREVDVLSPHRAESPSRTLPPEWLEQIQKLNPKYIVPSSCHFQQEDWSWYNRFMYPITYKQFESDIAQILPQTKVVRMNPGVSLQLQVDNNLKMSEPLEFVIPIGEQNVDYDYRDDLIIPSMSEVAKYFPELDLEKKLFVQNFLQNELSKKFKILPNCDEIFFDSPRLWELALYDSQGRKTSYFYKLNGVELTSVSDIGVNKAQWLTEVISTKLYNALCEGETITTMYLRINDRLFHSEIESLIQKADVLCDPLIRVLSLDSVGAYQRAQLERIKRNCLV